MRTLFVFAMGCLVAVSLWAAGNAATGEWAGQMEMRNGNAMKVDLVLKASGSNLTGTISSRSGPVEISDGNVKGDAVSFNVVREFRGHQFTQHYQGTLDGDTIHFTISREGGMSRMGHGRSRKLDLKRVRH